MPHVVNGIGTWYWGKRNVRVRRSVCEQCKRVADLRSYDSTLYFVVLFLPILPLKKVRVMEECSLCKMHRVASLRKWERARAQVMGDAIKECREHPTDAAKIRQAIGACVAFEDEQTFAEVAAIASETMTGDAEAQDALGSAYAFFGHNDLAELSFRSSLNLRDDPEVAMRLAVHLLRTARPAEGWSLMQPLMSAQHPDRLGAGYLAAMAFQAEGNHEAALGVLDHLVRVQPNLEKDKEYIKLRKLSEKNRASGKKIKSDLLSGPTGEFKERRLLSRLPSVIAMLAAIALIGAYLGGSWYRGRHRLVHVVSGVDVPSTVTIGATQVTLHPFGVREIHIPEGTHSVHATVGPVTTPPTTVTISTPFFARLFMNRTYVINADKLALIEWERAVYTTKANAAPQNELKWHSGETLHEFAGIDYEFKPFPSQIRSKASMLEKERIDVVRAPGIGAAWSLLASTNGQDSARAWIKDAAALMTSDATVYQFLLAVCPTDEAMAALKPLLAMRPVLVEPHRAYQELMDAEHPEHDLVDEYRKLLAASPDDPALQYLLGRATHDMEEAMALYRRAVNSPTPMPRAHSALAYQLMASARFDEALESARTARSLLPDDPAAIQLEGDLLLALRKYDELLKLPPYSLTAEEMNPVSAIRKCVLLALSGKQDEMERWMVEYAGVLQQGESEPLGETWRRCAEATAAYAIGDAKPLALLGVTDGARAVNREVAASLGLEGYFTVSALAGERFDDALKEMDAEESDAGWRDRLLVSIAASLAGNTDLASSQAEAAAKELAAGGWEYRLVGEWLRATEPPSVKQATSLPMPAYEKVVALTVLGIRFPEIRTDLFKLATKLNLEPEFPYLLLNAAHAKRDWGGR